MASHADERGVSGAGRRVSRGTARLVLTVVAAAAIGVGVPLLWVWIGSAIQGTSGATSVDGSTAAVMMVGIVLTYVGILFCAGWIQSRMREDEGGDGTEPVRHPWNRSMRDEPYRPGERRLTPVESAFVFTAVIVSGAFLVWFFAFAGSPLPNA